MKILEDLYVGDVRPNERFFKRNSQYAKALDEVVKDKKAFLSYQCKEIEKSNRMGKTL